MISFACKEIEFKDLLRCSFELTKTEYKIMMFLLVKDKYFSATALGESMNLDRTTIQKAVKGLTEKDLIIRHQDNLEKGGYMFFYKIKNKAEIKNRMTNLVDKWHEGVKKEIRNW